MKAGGGTRQGLWNRPCGVLSGGLAMAQDEILEALEERRWRGSHPTVGMAPRRAYRPNLTQVRACLSSLCPLLLAFASSRWKPLFPPATPPSPSVVHLGSALHGRGGRWWRRTATRWRS